MTSGVDSYREPGAFMERDWDSFPPRNIIERQIVLFQKVFNRPMVKLREWIVSQREPYPYYHRKYQRVPTIDQCYTYDNVCKWEANQQFKRDKKLEENIMRILHKRLEHCIAYEGAERARCEPLRDIAKEAELNFFIKYGDIGMTIDAEKVLTKQKHRMAWERRHGPIGTGMKQKRIRNDGTTYYE